MSPWVFYTLLVLASVTYVIAGRVTLPADIAEGSRVEGANFTYVPELLLFPVVTIALAKGIDSFATPWGSRIIAGLYGWQLLINLVLIARVPGRMRNAGGAPVSPQAPAPSSRQDLPSGPSQEGTQ